MRKIAYASAYVGATNEPAIRLGEKIVNHAYSNSSAVYYTTGGAESNESAFKTARFFWKVQDRPDKTKIISRTHGYHGVTMAAMSATGMAAYHKMFGPLMPGFCKVAAPYPYRWQGNQECGIGAAEAVEKAILAEGPETVAAVIAEPVMGRRRRHRAARQLFPQATGDLRAVRRAADRRRGHHRLRPHRPLVRARSIGASSPTSCPLRRA
jgi:adenosylmethionine-8-amino-7-oxononanoate aminotransferase